MPPETVLAILLSPLWLPPRLAECAINVLIERFTFETLVSRSSPNLLLKRLWHDILLWMTEVGGLRSSLG